MESRRCAAAAFKQSRALRQRCGSESATFRALTRRYGCADVEFESGEHEVDHRLPVFEVEIAGQSLQVMEEGLAGGQLSPHPSVGLVAEVQNRVKEESQQVEHDQHHGQVLLAMAEVVL